ncbi:MAG TPA: hypothetical protein VHO06_03235 [Polyangia bacterium]|nr:hypothetical protein [Polyangia bacterium]
MRTRDVRRFSSLVLWTAIAAAAAMVVGVQVVYADQPVGAPNRCGCRSDSAGACYCDRNAKCGCPGECEPKGCEEKRAKEMDRQVEIETKKAKAAAHEKRPLKSTDDESPPAARAAYQPAAKHAEHRMSAANQRDLARLLREYVAQDPEARHLTVESLMSSLSPAKAH